MRAVPQRTTRTLSPTPASKVDAPRHSRNFPIRDRLVSRFDPLLEARGPNIALVAAPTGYGKTTLLSDVADAFASRRAVAWAALDSSDDDPRRFWSTVVSAMDVGTQQRRKAFGSLLPHAGSPGSEFVQLLCETADSLDTETILILDDLHHIKNPEVLDQLGLLLRRAPRTLRTVISTRYDPVVPLHAERIAGNVVEVRGRDLALTVDELAAALSDDNLPATDHDAILDLTEGWPAGVQLARTVIREPGDGERLADLFNSHPGVLSDYLFHEAFTAQDATSQHVLLATACVRDASDDLAVALTGVAEAGAVLAGIADRTGLVTRHPSESNDGLHYRLHPLLRSFLLARFSQRDRPGLLATYTRAVRWFTEHDRPWESLNAAVSSQEPAVLDDVLQQVGVRLLLMGQGADVVRALEQAPVKTEWSVALSGLAAATIGDLDLARTHLATEAPDDAGDSRESGEPLDLRLSQIRWSTAALLAESGPGPIRPPGPAPGVDDLRDDHLGLLVSMHRVHAQISSGHHADLTTNVANVRHLADALGVPCLQAEALLLDTISADSHGDYESSADLGERVLGATDGRPLHVTTVPRALYLLAWSAFQRLDDDTSRERTRQAVGHLPATGDPLVEFTTTTLNALTMPEWIDADASERLQRTWERYTGPAVHPQFIATAAFPRARRAVAAGRTDLLRHIVDNTQRHLGDTGDVAALRAFSAVSEGRSQDARRLLEPVLHDGSAWVSPIGQIEAHLLQASLDQTAQRSYQAFDAVTAALDLVAETAATRPLAEVGPEVHALLTDNFDRLSRYHAYLAPALAYECPLTHTEQLVEPLTERELEVLRELPTLDSVEEISEHLLISTNTVKTHIRAVYRKLDVSSRRRAISEARRHRLL